MTTIAVARAGDRYVIEWDEAALAGPVAVRVAERPGGWGDAPPRVTGAHGRAEVTVAPDALRCYFELRPARGETLQVAERGVPLAGGVNFRDLGGYRTDDGRRVRWGRLFRSGHMANLTAADKALFGALEIGTVCDFRLAEESASERTELPGAPALHILGIPPGIGDKTFFHRLFAERSDAAATTEAMHRMLEHLVRDAAPYYAQLFEVLLAGPPGAVLMNCSAGKERTGVAVLLVLAALGVPRATIMYDFMLSGRYFPAESEVPRVREKYGVTAPEAEARALIMPLLETRASYLEAAFAAIDADFGSTGAMLRERFGLGQAQLARLRELYTE